MKLPRIVADQGIPAQIPGGFATANEFGAGAAQVLDEGTRQATHAGLRAADQFAYASDVLEKAKAKAELDGAVTAFKGQMTDADIALQERGIDPEQYPTQLRAAIKDRASAISDQITSPSAKTAFAAHAGALAETKLTEAKWDALKVRRGLNRMMDSKNQIDDANTAVYGSSTEERQKALQDLVDRPARGLQQGIYTPAEADALLKAGMKHVVTAGAWRDSRNPELHDQLLDTLDRGGMSYLDPNEQRQLRESILKRDQEDENAKDRSQARLDREISKQRTAGFADLTDQVLKGGQTEESARAHPAWNFLEGGQREHIITMIREPKSQPSDPATVASVINRLGDRPTISEAQIKALHVAGKLNDKEATQFMAAVRERTDYWRGIGRADSHRAEDQNLAEVYRRNGEVFAIGIRELSTTGSIAEKLNPVSQELQGLLQRSLLTRSKGAGRPMAGFPRNEEPEAVLYDVMPPLMERLKGSTENEMYGLQAEINRSPYKTPQDLFKKFPGDPAQYAGNAEYVAASKRFLLQRDYGERVQRLNNSLDAIRKRAQPTAGQ